MVFGDMDSYRYVLYMYLCIYVVDRLRYVHIMSEMCIISYFYVKMCIITYFYVQLCISEMT